MVPITAEFRRGAQLGLDRATVGNLVAFEHGLGPVAGGWKPKEIAALLFTRHRFGGSGMTVDEAASVYERPPDEVLNPVPEDPDRCPECTPFLCDGEGCTGV